MKKIINSILLFIFIFSSNFGFVFAESRGNYFIVTAYYSPLPNQNYYLKGNYEDELKLNGNGIAGASGQEVFAGMLAAPSNYKFGTKIYIDGLGIGSVEDRGGAIVNAGKRGYEHDRIDVWMGYGDEGLRRALYWGKRKVVGNIIASNSQTTINLNNIPSPMWATQNLKKIPNIFNMGIGKDSDYSLIIKLQEFLNEINLYDGNIDGIYNNELIDLIYDFQIDNEIIKSGDLYGAGYWGNATRNLILKKYLNGEFDEKEEIVNISEETSIIELVENNVNIEIFESFSKTIDDIKKLQNILKELSLYSGEINGNYDDIVDTIFDFQVSEGILKFTYDAGAGNYGPKTRESLKKYYELFKDNKEELRREEIKIEEEKIKEELRIVEEKLKEENRKKELENKFNRLDEISSKRAEEKISLIGEPKFGDVSIEVRELQLLLKELGYFDYKDTAIFGDITKKSILSFQIDNKLVTNENDLGAGMIGPVTKGKIKELLKNNYLDELIISEKLNKDELVDIGVLSI